MFIAKLTLLTIGVYGVLFLSGWGLSAYACKEKYPGLRVLLTPILGVIPLSFLPGYLSLAGVPTRWGGWIAFIIFGLLSLWHLFREPMVRKPTKFKFPLLPAIILLGILPSFMILMKAGFLTSTFQSYSAFVVSPTDYLIHHTLTEPIILDWDRPSTNVIFETLNNKQYFGFYFFLASLCAIFALLPHELYLIVSGVIGSLIPLSVFIACVEGFGLERKRAVTIAFLVSINVSYYNWPLVGQLPMTLGIIYMILLMGFLPSMISCHKKSDYLLYSLILTGLVANYFLLGAYLAGAFIFYLIFNPRLLKETPKIVKNLFLFFFLSLLINPLPYIYLGSSLTDVTRITSAVTNNIPRYPYAEELMGFGNHFSLAHDWSLSSIIAILLAASCVCVIVAGIFERFRNGNTLFVSGFLVFVLLGAYFFFIDFTYHFYKNAVIGVFMLVIAFVTGIDSLYDNARNGSAKTALSVILVGFVALNANNYIKNVFYSFPPIVSNSLSDLDKLAGRVPDDKIILVNSFSPTEEAWASYFLRQKKIKLRGALEPWGFWILSPFTGEPKEKFFYNPNTDQVDFTLTTKRGEISDIVEIEHTKTVMENEGYILFKGVPNPYLAKGWHNVETSRGSPFRWTEGVCNVYFNRPREDAFLLIRGEVPDAYKDPLDIQIRVNDILLATITSASGPEKINNRYSLAQVPLKDSANHIQISLSDSFTPNQRFGSNDLRRLGIRINSLVIYSMEELGIAESINIGHPEADKFLLDGWSHKEISPAKISYSWVEGKDARLNICVSEPRDLKMKFRAIPFSFPGSPLQEAKIYVNSVLLNTIEMADDNWSIYETAVPADALKPGLNVIGISLSHSESPSRVLKYSADHRELSVAFDYIRFY